MGQSGALHVPVVFQIVLHASSRLRIGESLLTVDEYPGRTFASCEDDRCRPISNPCLGQAQIHGSKHPDGTSALTWQLVVQRIEWPSDQPIGLETAFDARIAAAQSRTELKESAD